MQKNSPHPQTTDQQYCPLCGGDNQCVMANTSLDNASDSASNDVATGVAPTDCWCFHTAINRELIDRIPASEKSRRCICPRCAEAVDRLARPAS